jgi:hypothetical protein
MCLRTGKTPKCNFRKNAKDDKAAVVICTAAQDCIFKQTEAEYKSAIESLLLKEGS